MRFFGGLLKVLSIFLILADTVGWTMAIVLEYVDYGMSETIWLMLGFWFGILVFLLAMLGTGIALTQTHKLKKRVQQLEQRANTMPQYMPSMSMPVETPQYIPAAPAVQTPPVAVEQEKFYEEPKAEPVEASGKEKKQGKGSKKVILLVVAVIVVIAVVAVILLTGGKDKPGTVAVENGSYAQVEYPADNEEPQQQEATIDATPVSMGGCIENENFTMTFESMELFDEFSYRTSDYSSTSLFIEDGYKALVVQGHFTNNSTGTISDSAFSMTATINDTYTVDGYDVRISFIRSNTFEIDAYTDVDYVLYVNVPEKLVAEFETASFTIGFKNDMSYPMTTWHTDGTKSVDIDQQYILTGGLGTAATSAANEAPAQEEYKWATIGETIYTDEYEFTLRNVEMTYELLPPNTSSVYVSYPAESGKVFVHVEADVKNVMQRDIRIDELFTAGALYDMQYPYEGFTLVNDGDNRFDWVSSYVAATPLETCRAHSLIECPVEVDTSGKSVYVNINIGDEVYYYKLR